MRRILPSIVSSDCPLPPGAWPLPESPAPPPSPRPRYSKPSGPKSSSPPLWFAWGCVDGEQLAARPGVDCVAAHRVFVDTRIAFSIRVVHVDLGAVGRERQAEQAALATAADVGGDVEHRRRVQRTVPHGAHPPHLLGDVQRAVAAADRERGRVVDLRDRRELHVGGAELRVPPVVAAPPPVEPGRGRRRRTAVVAARGRQPAPPRRATASTVTNGGRDRRRSASWP